MGCTSSKTPESVPVEKQSEAPASTSAPAEEPKQQLEADKQTASEIASDPNLSTKEIIEKLGEKVDEIIHEKLSPDHELTAAEEKILEKLVDDVQLGKSVTEIAADVAKLEELVDKESSTVEAVAEEIDPSVPPTKKGFITKQGQFMKNWNSRYFVLQKGDLSYYEKPDNLPPYGINKKGNIPSLKDKIITDEPGEFIIKIDGGNTRDIILKFDSDEHKKEWVDALTAHITYSSSKA